ncbi:MAG: hypothetical protein ACOCRX_12165 [Candidatus Woesearchaeota archaeon]
MDNNILQKAYNLLPNENTLFTDSIIDNITLNTINGCGKRDTKTIFNIVNGYQAAFYIT